MSRFGAAVDRVDQRLPGVDLPLLSVSQTRGVIRRSELTDRPQRAESLDVYKVCRRGDVVFNKMSIRSGAMGVAPEDGLVTYHYEVMRPRRGFDPRYVVYLMKSDYFTSELIKRERGIGSGEQTGVRTTEVPFRILRTVEVFLPESVEQVAIADFLDRETATIDVLIEKQQALIDGLGRRRGVAISQAVDAESLAALPGPRLRHAVAEVRQGWSPQCNNWPAEGNDWAVLKAGCVNGGLFRPGENKQLPDSLEPRPETVVRREELVVSRANTLELVGSAAVVHDASPRLMLSDKLYALTLREEINPDFAAFALGTRRYRDLIELEATGASSSMQNISQRVILDLPFCVPSRAEQDAAVVEIRALVAELDQLVSKAERFIELAKERRAALITAAVTGELDVAGEVA